MILHESRAECLIVHCWASHFALCLEQKVSLIWGPFSRPTVPLTRVLWLPVTDEKTLCVRRDSPCVCTEHTRCPSARGTSTVNQELRGGRGLRRGGWFGFFPSIVFCFHSTVFGSQHGDEKGSWDNCGTGWCCATSVKTHAKETLCSVLSLLHILVINIHSSNWIFAWAELLSWKTCPVFHYRPCLSVLVGRRGIELEVCVLKNAKSTNK